MRTVINGVKLEIGPGAFLRHANLSYTDIIGADLSYADLSYADLRGANLSYADLSHANLFYANLSGANLSGVLGLATARDLLSTFQADEYGVIVYKAIGSTDYEPPGSWVIAPGSVITEAVNPDRCTLCGCGINVASLEWVQREYPDSTHWRCRIAWRDLADVVVPYGTDGKFRCGRLRLLEVVT